jgi:hypothetical protein
MDPYPNMPFLFSLDPIYGQSISSKILNHLERFPLQCISFLNTGIFGEFMHCCNIFEKSCHHGVAAATNGRNFANMTFTIGKRLPN